MPNRLSQERSPYLRQHAENPVDWYPWAEEASRRAREEDKPVHVAVGYTLCHWCHVMAHECFDNPAIAALRNERFINIKVDRHERFDLDHIYQQVLQMTGQGGGLPLTVFMTPQGEPFIGATYFTPVERHGRPGSVSRPAFRPSEAAAGAALLGRIEPEGAPWRGPSTGRRGALGLVRQGAQGCRFGPSWRPVPDRWWRPDLIATLEDVLDKAGLRDADIVMRMTGCPNGCSRPYLAAIGLVGRAPGLCNLYLGGAFDGARLNKLYAQDVDHAQILKLLDALIVQYANERNEGERFGDFMIRSGSVTATLAGNRCHDNMERADAQTAQ